ncbi:MAG TPA: class I SAM-dependent methyltransferase [Patescibacteria group bacterium]|nr:class I SAM-dependent methyltransferase [Patescibacteria group bacterium]
MNELKKQLKTAYDADAKRRDSLEGKRDQWKLDIRQKFVELLKKENKTTILELGSGAGLDAKYFQESGFKVLATDLSDKMVEMCKKRGLDARVFDLYDLPSLGTTFDGIFSLNVLLHVPKKDLDDVLQNIHRVLNNDGVFYYGVYGGMNEEKTLTDKKKMNLPRFFSFLSD